MARTAVIVTARNEADRLPSTLAAVARALPGSTLLLADDGSTDATASIANRAGARVLSSGSAVGKGAAATRAARMLLADADAPEIVVFCDGDLGDTAVQLAALVDAVAAGRCDVAVAAFARRVGGGVGAAVGFARWAVRVHTGLSMRAPISGQRALRMQALSATLPFERGFGMEIGMTIDAVRAGFEVAEIELDLEHRATGRTLEGFVHRGRQLWDFAGAFLRRCGGGAP